jgi:hypothetical protein
LPGRASAAGGYFPVSHEKVVLPGFTWFHPA